MTIPFSIGGARTVIPGVYDRFRVEDSLLSPAAAGRSVFLLGEASEGIPGSALDLQLNFFTDYASVLDFYKSGPIVDAARQLFSTQPSPAFTGRIDRLYVYKTNATTRASRALANSYGSIVAARYGEAGNFIKSQIADSQSEALPSLSFHYAPITSAELLKVVVNGKSLGTVARGSLNIGSATGTPAEIAANLDALAGVSATGGTARTMLATGTTVNASFASPSAGVLAITLASGTWSTSATGAAAGDVACIEPATSLSGASDQNAGVYMVQTVTASVITMVRVYALDATGVASAQAFDLTPAPGISAVNLNDSIGAWSEIALTQTEASASGSAASLELLESTASALGALMLHKHAALSNALSSAGAAVGSLEASAPAAGQLLCQLSGASWASTPKAGDVAWISDASALAGATKKNIGLYTVLASSHNSMKLQNCAGLTTEAVAQFDTAGEANSLQIQAGVATTEAAARRINSATERQVQVLASRTSDGAQFTQTAAGGRSAIEMSYYDGVSTAAKVSIDQNRNMKLQFTGGPSDITINTKKYATLGDLVDFLGTITGMSARVVDNRMKSDSPRTLDMASNVGILSGSATAAYNGRIKRDYADFKRLLDDNFGLIAFSEGTATLKCGLPAAEAQAAFLTGGTIGASSNADIQAGLDAGLKIDTRVVLPAMSRDANKDVDDGLTDSSSSYTIDSIHAALLAHVSTASSTLFKRERFGSASFHGSFADAKNAASAMGNERIQMAFQMCRATDSSGNLQWFQPWMAMASLTAGRAQAQAGQPMLRKSFLLTAVKHIGDKSVTDDTLTLDFDAEDRGQLTQAIEAGLLVWKAARGQGIRLESPDSTTRSRDNDPQGWVWERASVLFACDEVRQTLRESLENLIGRNTVEVTEQDVRRTAEAVLKGFVSQGVLIKFAINKVTNLGNGYTLQVDIFPPEAVEFIGVDVMAKRAAA